MKSTFFSALTTIMVLVTLGMNVSAGDRLLHQEPDSFVKLGDIKGDYRSDPDPYMKLGDIKGEYKTETSREELNDLLQEYEYWIWEAEADDFFWRNRQRLSTELLDRWIWEEESGDF